MRSLGAVELLYTQHGRPKNAEIATFLEWLIGPEMADLPFDRAFIGGESGLGAPFSDDPGNQTPLIKLRLDRQGLTPDARAYLETRMQKGKVKLDHLGADADRMVKDLPGASVVSSLMGGDGP